MISFDFEVVKQDIEACLKIGNEKLDVAIMLRKAEVFPSGISSYIRAFEELGFALFLTEKACGPDSINENDWKKLVIPANHNQKILANYIGVKNQFVKNPESDFKRLKNSPLGNSFKFDLNRTQALVQINERIAIYSKLDDLRKKFDHSHDLDGHITIQEYGEKDLEAVCHLLEAECFSSYYRSKLHLEGYPINLSLDTEENKLVKINSLSSTKKLKELNQKYYNSDLELRKRGLKFLKSL